MSKMKKVVMYATGTLVPDDAIYLSTIVQPHPNLGKIGSNLKPDEQWLTWNFFTVKAEYEKPREFIPIGGVERIEE